MKLGSLITENGEYLAEINRRVEGSQSLLLEA